MRLFHYVHRPLSLSFAALAGMTMAPVWAAIAPGLPAEQRCQAHHLQQLEEAATAGTTRAQHALGNMLVDGVCGWQDVDAGIAWIEQAAEAGHVQAQHERGMLLLGTASDTDERHHALYWLGSAAGHGDGFSATVLGVIHEQGMHGVPMDICVALDWYETGLLLGFDDLSEHYHVLLGQWHDACY